MKSHSICILIHGKAFLCVWNSSNLHHLGFLKDKCDFYKDFSLKFGIEFH
jgi:hypothetical protein